MGNFKGGYVMFIRCDSRNTVQYDCNCFKVTKNGLK